MGVKIKKKIRLFSKYSLQYFKIIYEWWLKGSRSFLLGVFFSLIFFLLLFRHLPQPFIDARTINGVTSKIDTSYDIKVLTTSVHPDPNPSIIVWGNDKRLKDYCFNTREIRLKQPILNIYKKNDFSISSLLPFFKQEYKINRTFSFKIKKETGDGFLDDYWISDVQVEDLDGDGTDEIIVKALGFPCGSGSSQYQFILNDNGSGLEITDTLPQVSIDNEGKLLNLSKPTKIVKDGKELEIQFTTVDTYIGYKDLDDDNKKELIVGSPLFESEKWGQDGYCHSCPAFWLIGVYKFHKTGFIIDNNWSYGNLYKTEKKIGLYDAIGYPALSANLFNVFAPYYFECKECGSFYNLSRRKSELLKIVEAKYANFKTRDELQGY